MLIVLSIVQHPNPLSYYTSFSSLSPNTSLFYLLSIPLLSLNFLFSLYHHSPISTFTSLYLSLPSHPSLLFPISHLSASLPLSLSQTYTHIPLLSSNTPLFSILSLNFLLCLDHISPLTTILPLSPPSLSPLSPIFSLTYLSFLS